MTSIETIDQITYDLKNGTSLICHVSKQCAPCNLISPKVFCWMQGYSYTKRSFDFEDSETNMRLDFRRVNIGEQTDWEFPASLSRSGVIAPLPNFSITNSDHEIVTTLQNSDPDTVIGFLITHGKIEITL